MNKAGCNWFGQVEILPYDTVLPDDIYFVMLVAYDGRRQPNPL